MNPATSWTAPPIRSIIRVRPMLKYTFVGWSPDQPATRACITPMAMSMIQIAAVNRRWNRS